MNFHDLPLLIPLFAAGYLLAIYVLLMLVQRNAKASRS